MESEYCCYSKALSLCENLSAYLNFSLNVEYECKRMWNNEVGMIIAFTGMKGVKDFYSKSSMAERNLFKAIKSAGYKLNLDPFRCSCKLKH